MAEPVVSYQRFASAFGDGVDHALLVELAAEAPQSESLTAELAHAPDSELRAWVAHALPELVAREAVTPEAASSVLLEIAKDDADPDIRDEAVRSLLKLDRDSALSLAPLLRGRMSSSDYYAPVVAMWTLAELGAYEALDDVLDYMRRVGEDTWQGRQAHIVARVMANDHKSLASQIEAHDHDMMHALCRAVGLMTGDRLRLALERCSAQFDEECSRQCRGALEARAAGNDRDDPGDQA